MAPRLPLELVEMIIDDVVAEFDNDDDDDNHDIDNHSSIKACALVCHSFLPLCRKHIFASVVLNAQEDSRPSSPTSHDFDHLLSNLPHLAVYIRKVDYHISRDDYYEGKYWLFSLFKKLVKLQKLGLLGIKHSRTLPGYDLNSSRWKSLPERKIFLFLLSHPNLTRICLENIWVFLLADLALCVNLKELEIGPGLSCLNNVGDLWRHYPPTPVMLERLVINRGNIEPVQELCIARRPDGKPMIDFSSLKIITVDVARLELLKDVFAMCRNLHKIDLVTFTTFDNSGLRSSLKGLFTMLKPSLPTLVDIDITYNIDNNDDETYDAPLDGLCCELQKMTGQNVVETINLRILIRQEDFYCSQWDELDDVLGSPEGWPALRKVSISFIFIMASKDDNPDEVDDPDDEVPRELPMTKLVENKRVQFDFKTRVFPEDHIFKSRHFM